MSNGTKVKKRDGRIESLDLDKMHLMVAEATRGSCRGLCKSGRDAIGYPVL